MKVLNALSNPSGPVFQAFLLVPSFYFHFVVLEMFIAELGLDWDSDFDCKWKCFVFYY